MASKQTELHVDDLLNSLDSRTTTKGAKDTKAAKVDNNDWDDQEEDNFALGIGRTQQATKAKAKKKTVAKGWGDIDAGSAPQQPTVQDFAAIQDGEKKKKIFNKPNGQAKAPVNFETEAEYFPSLGEERPKQAPKKPEPTPVVQPTVASSSGVKKFVNAKKQGAGENFVALEPVQERALPVVPEKTEPAVVQQKPAGFGFQRRAAEEQPKEVPADTKFKFGGEGPKKFSAGGKISFKREEEKSEQELAREEKEREIEERLARQREELAKERETRKAAKGDEKNESPKAKLEKTEKVEKVEEKTEQPVEEKRIAKFSNSKKAEKAQAEPVVEQKVQEVVAEVKLSGPAETVEMNGTLSNKAWGDGPLLKKAQKK